MSDFTNDLLNPAKPANFSCLLSLMFVYSIEILALSPKIIIIPEHCGLWNAGMLAGSQTKSSIISLYAIPGLAEGLIQSQ